MNQHTKPPIPIDELELELERRRAAACRPSLVAFAVALPQEDFDAVQREGVR